MIVLLFSFKLDRKVAGLKKNKWIDGCNEENVE